MSEPQTRVRASDGRAVARSVSRRAPRRAPVPPPAPPPPLTRSVYTCYPLDMANIRTVALDMDARQHALTLTDLRQLAEWMDNGWKKPPQFYFDNGPTTIAARLRDLHDAMTAYEER